MSTDQTLNGIGEIVYFTAINLIHFLKYLQQQESSQLGLANLYTVMKLLPSHYSDAESVGTLKTC